MLRRKQKDPEIAKIAEKMDEIKSENRKAVKELEELNKTLKQMEKKLRNLKGL